MLDQTWFDPLSSWCAKADRARQHLDSLRELVTEFRRSEPYSITPEPTSTPGRLAYRLRYHRPIPVEVSTMVGDILHNLRAALESLAFELARRSQGGSLTPDQEGKTAFPICVSPTHFDRLFAGRYAGLFDDRSRRALRVVQPFVNLEQAHRVGVALDKTFEDSFRWSELHRLNELWNIDKHRRLTVAAWWPHMYWWQSNGPSGRRMLRGDGTMGDGSILFHMEGSDPDMDDTVHSEFNLVVKDDPAFPLAPDVTQDVLETMGQFQSSSRRMYFAACSASCQPDG